MKLCAWPGPAYGSALNNMRQNVVCTSVLLSAYVLFVNVYLRANMWKYVLPLSEERIRIKEEEGTGHW